MSSDDYLESDIQAPERMLEFIRSIQKQERELVLTSGDEVVGAILTAEQYEWFLDQLDAAQDTSFVAQRLRDLEGTQSLDDFKKELRGNDEQS